MRRAFLFAGIAAGAVALFTSATFVPFPSKTSRINAHLEKVREVAFCQKGYEIASSFPSYESRQASSNYVKALLVQQADQLEAKSKHLDELLNTDLKQEAQELGLGSFEYETKLATIRLEAEREAVMAFQQTDDKHEIIGQLDELSKPFTE